jgi:Arc/MetJ-type ribon-helix-helix transcriptional regulator
LSTVFVVVICSTPVVKLTTSHKQEKNTMATLKNRAQETRATSIRLPNHLYEKLEQKAQELGGIGMSDTVRSLLQMALEQPDPKEDKKLLKQLLHYNIATYYMVQTHLLSEFEEGEELNDEAHQKANKILERLLQKKV